MLAGPAVASDAADDGGDEVASGADAATEAEGSEADEEGAAVDASWEELERDREESLPVEVEEAGAAVESAGEVEGTIADEAREERAGEEEASCLVGGCTRAAVVDRAADS